MSSSAALTQQLRALRAALPAVEDPGQTAQTDSGDAPMSLSDAVQTVGRLRRTFRNARHDLPDSAWQSIRAGN